MTKKILITGMNNLQSRYDYCFQQELKVVATQYSLTRALADMGWYVEQRPVMVGEDLSGYDEVITYIHTPTAFAQQLYGGLWAIATRPDSIISIDDWQFDQIISGIESFLVRLDDGDKAFNEYLLSLYQGSATKDELVKHKDLFKDACKRILSFKDRFLVAGFAGGDMSLTGIGWSKERTFVFNPNPYHLNRSVENGFGRDGIAALVSSRTPPESKSKTWVFSSLVKQKTISWYNAQNDDWKWPTLQFGPRRGKFKDLRVPEDEMCEIYEKNWGCLVPCYYHAGSGFWRPRALQLADALSVMVCDDKEGKIYSDAHVGVRAKDVEQMDVSQLAALAKSQRDGIYEKHPLDKSVTRREIQAVLDAPR